MQISGKIGVLQRKNVNSFRENTYIHLLSHSAKQYSIIISVSRGVVRTGAMAPMDFENMCAGTHRFKTKRLKNHR